MAITNSVPQERENPSTLAADMNNISPQDVQNHRNEEEDD